MKKRPLKIYIFLCLFALFAILHLIPAPASAVDGVRLYARYDDLIGTRPMYFALTNSGSLVGWGGKSVHSFRSTRDGYGSPYGMRRVLVKDVKEFACGAYTGMYIDTDNRLWGWGIDKELLFSDQNTSSGSAVKIMEDVQHIAVGREHAAAIKTDGTLWTWGRNGLGQLGIGTPGEKDGHSTDGNQYYEPQKVMDDVKSICILEDSITFAVTGNDDLYVWGNGAICSPRKIAEDIQTVNLAAITRHGTVFQCLSTAGTVFLFDLYAVDFEAQFHEPALHHAESVCRFAVTKEDDSLWKWDISESGSSLVEVEQNVAYAATPDFYLTDSGKLFVDSTLSVMHKPIVTVVPYLRNSLVLLCAALWIIQKGVRPKKQKNPC